MTDTSPPDLPLDSAELRILRRLLQFLDSEVPGPYRIPLFTHLLHRLAPRPAAAVRPARRRGFPRDEAAPPPTPITLRPYRVILQRRGNNLLKALAALDAAERQVGTAWLTPRQVTDLLKDAAGSRSIYRSNVSNALRTAEEVVDRRREGRGYAYRITTHGRETLERELRLGDVEG